MGSALYQPDVKFIAAQQLPNKRLLFQAKWFSLFPWLHYSPTMQKVLCFECVKAFSIKMTSLEKKHDPAFCLNGFGNWKNASESFTHHQNSRAHHHAVTVNAMEQTPVHTQLASALAKTQQDARHCLVEIMECVRYLARQGIAMRGHASNEGNLFHLVKLKAKNDPVLTSWLTRCHDYVSPQCQNEYLTLFGHTIVRGIAAMIRSLPIVHFSIIMDGTHDIQGKEQVSICLRYVDQDLVPVEAFIGLYDTPSTTGEQMAKLALDMLLRLNLPISGMRGQTYDGAANMAGRFSGAQAVLKKEQPLVLYVHCGAHCVNLITQCACNSSPLLCDALQWVHELGTLSKQSGKFKGILAQHTVPEGPTRTVKPLCPTRWTVRGQAVQVVLNEYEAILNSLEEMASLGSDTSTRANGLLERFQKGKTILGLNIATEVLGELECLNKSLQNRSQTIAGMQTAVQYVSSAIQEKRTDAKFAELFEKSVQMVDTLGIEAIEIPHQRKPPRRYTGQASHHQPKTAEEFYRIEFFKVLDCFDMQFKDRFNQPDLEKFKQVEDVLLTGKVNDTIGEYPEINRENLGIQLSMFFNKHPLKSSAEAAEILRGMPREVRGLFNHLLGCYW
uniref:TTF-type domain-containing protein n=1 Tax=Xiphophorus maculatus TaxID=8083 RepID=A0A3B5QLP4_XIPMA